MKLTKSEETLMQYIWELESAFMKDLLAQYPEPKPAPTTVATHLKRMTNKGFIDYEQHGRSREYYPLVSKSDYFSGRLDKLIGKFFNNSTAQFASFFASDTDLSAKELEEFKAIIDKEIQKKK